MKRYFNIILLVTLLLAHPCWAAFNNLEFRIDHILTGLNTSDPQLASDHKGHVYVAWQDERNSSGIYLNKSDDFGKTFSSTDTFIEFTSSIFQKSLNISTDQTGHIYAVWIALVGGEERIVFAESANFGQTFTSQVVNLGDPGFWLGNVDMAHDESGNICLIASGDGSFPRFIYANCSYDYGQTWFTSHMQVNANSPTSSQVQLDAKICGDENGNYYAAWIDGRDGVGGGWRHIFVNHSDDYGQTWNQDVRIQPISFAKHASSPNIVCNDTGHAYVAWHDFDGQFNSHSIYFNRTSDFGASWNNFKTLAANADSPQLQLGDSGKVYLTWVDNSNGSFRKIHFERSIDHGQSWDADIQVNDVHDTEASHYVHKAVGDYVSVVWENNEPYEHIYFDFSLDAGQTWQSNPIVVDVNSGIKTDKPKMMADSSANVYVAWEDNRDGDQHVYFNTGIIDDNISVFQNFEPNNGSDQYGWAFNGASVALSSEEVHFGSQAWKITAPGQFGGTGIQSQTQRWNMNFKPEDNDRLTFWLWADPSNTASNNVQVKFFDTGNYFANGFEVWTTKNAEVQEWTELEVLFSQLPPDFDLSSVNKLEFVNFWDGTYYLDDIHVTLKDRTYQAFERCTVAADCGWAWDGSVELENNIVYEGVQSWKLVTTSNWGGTGIQSQEKKYDPNEPDNQSPWHADLNPSQNDRLTFWVYNLADNGLANNVAVQFFDHGNYFSNPFVVWTKERAEYKQWTKLTILFSDLPADFDLTDINKIQLQVFWTGTYYFDDIRASQQTPLIDKSVLPNGTVQWNELFLSEQYELQESVDGSRGPWQTIYEGSGTTFQLDRISNSWLRLRRKEMESPLSPGRYVGDWTTPVEFNSPAAVIFYNNLKNGDIGWTLLPHGMYQVEAASDKYGPWTEIYRGTHTTLIGQASNDEYYRVRGIIDQGNTIVDASDWSPAITYDSDNFVVAIGKELKEQMGAGDTVVLKGINFGNLLLIEPEFTGIGGQFTPGNPFDDDDFGIRQELITRFDSDDLLLNYQNAYLQLVDFDHIMRTGANVIRLPIYHEVLQDGSGGYTNFSKIDEIVEACANRGIYVILDLHGAPGAQSDEIHAGRANYNRLFEDSPDSENFRNQTIQLWEDLALHYKDHPMVVGYDLLNEPFGADDHDPTYMASNGLWTLYNDLYNAIRIIDNNHLIIMEGIPALFDWDTLPEPSQYGWSNVMYQFHFYCFLFDGNGQIAGTCDVVGHQTFLEEKVLNSEQDVYNVPVFIGEFNGFDHKDNWDMHMQTYQNQNWNWAMWTYKTHPNLPNWGLFTHSEYNDLPPDVSIDDESILSAKFAKFDTQVHHVADQTLISLLNGYFKPWNDVIWTDLVGVVANGNSITKTAPTAWGNAGAASLQRIPGDGGVDFRADETNTYRMCGLSSTNANANWSTIHYAVYLLNNGTVRVYESGAFRGSFGSYAAGDRFSVERTGGTVEYKRNGTTFYTSTIPSSGDLIIDAAFYTSGGTVADVKVNGDVPFPNVPPVAEDQSVTIFGGAATAITLVATDAEGSPLTYSIVNFPTDGFLTGTPPNLTYTRGGTIATSDSFTFKANDGEDDSNIATVNITIFPNPTFVVWRDLVGVSIGDVGGGTGNILTKTAPTQWGNGGAASSQIIPGDGGVEFIAEETNTYRLCGLSSSNANASYNTIGYALYTLANGTIQVYENGASRGAFGMYTAGDPFIVERNGSTIQYKHNGTIFYTSTIASSGDLVVDAAIYNQGGTIAGALVFGGVDPPNNPPVADDQNVKVIQDTPADITLTASDPDQDPLTYAITNGPSNGTLSGSGPTVTYTPNSGYLGNDSFQFQVNDGEDSSNVATVVINVVLPPTPVQWTDFVGVVANGNSITKTAPTAWGNAGAASLQRIPGDGGVDFRADETNTYRMCGLSSTNTNANYNTINYAMYAAIGGNIYVFESGINRGIKGNYSMGDRLSVERTGNSIEYKQNGNIIYTSTIPSSGDLIVDTAIYNTGGTISDANISGSQLTSNNPPVVEDEFFVAVQDIPFFILLRGTDTDGDPVMLSIVSGPSNGMLSGGIPNVQYTPNPGFIGIDSFTYKGNDGQVDSNIATVTISVIPPTMPINWTDLVGVSVSTNSITKTAPTAWGNAGAASLQRIPGDGGVDFRADETNTYRMCGLSSTNTNANWNTIHYAIYLLNDSSIRVYENGSFRGIFGNYAVGDRFTVERLGSTVQYKHNGTVIYSSTIPSNGDLIVDTALYTTGATIADVKVNGGI